MNQDPYHTEMAQVAAANEEHLWLEPLGSSGCSSCSANQTCGTGLLQKVLGRRRLELKLPNTINAQVGDHLVVGIPQRGLFLASSLLYLLPIITLFVGAAIVDTLGFTEWWQVTGATVGFCVGLLIARYVADTLQANAIFELKVLDKHKINIELQTH